jgi:two-component system CheB/CheR fusion protein
MSKTQLSQVQLNQVQLSQAQSGGAPGLVQQRQELADFQHRLKNLMAIIRAIADRTVRNSANMEEFAAHFEGRLTALARSQKILARTAAFEIDLEELAREELLSHSAAGLAKVAIEGPRVRLRQKAADNIGLALNELATNALKFGALSCAGGRLAIGWRVCDGTTLSLQWQESGVALLDPNPSRSGFGREFIEQALPYHLGATTRLEFRPGGILCTIAFALSGNAVLCKEGSFP